MFVVVRFNVPEGNANVVQYELARLCNKLTQNYTNEEPDKVFKVYQTPEATAYQEVAKELANDAASLDHLNIALDGLKEDVLNHPDWHNEEESEESE